MVLQSWWREELHRHQKLQSEQKLHLEVRVKHFLTEMPQISDKNSARFRGLVEDSCDAKSDALSDARYKQYIQIIYTPVSSNFLIVVHELVTKGNIGDLPWVSGITR